MLRTLDLAIGPCPVCSGMVSPVFNAAGQCFAACQECPAEGPAFDADEAAEIMAYLFWVASLNDDQALAEAFPGLRRDDA